MADMTIMAGIMKNASATHPAAMPPPPSVAAIAPTSCVEDGPGILFASANNSAVVRLRIVMHTHVHEQITCELWRCEPFQLLHILLLHHGHMRQRAAKASEPEERKGQSAFKATLWHSTRRSST